ncbi:DUF11 domain-containing protein [Deinococcus daejeonensis]|uniref:Uncharacterized protein n=1 Tax=Deinococcus daejeonensis TaxID=1007098 RepID=A0ABQ2J5S2_9DEIO|nr:DUF11 domain-containing protein [Deinococcus daejeonensis]GGN38210.1 hypothetical protein GCM10010842_20840 [Deinococcus daejeonensis]
MKKNILITALLTLSTTAAALGTPAGETIQNVGQFEYTDFDNTSKTIDTAAPDITVAAVYAANLSANGSVATPGQTVTAAPGETATLVYTLRNDGNIADTFNLTVQNGAGAPLSGTTIYIDTNNNGVVDAGDTPVTSVSALPADSTVQLLVTYTVPTNTPAGQSTYVNLVATSAGNSAVIDNNNVGEISAMTVVRYTLATDNTRTAQPYTATQVTHTLTNTGNTALIAADLRASSTLGGTTTASGTISYTVVNSGTGASVSNASLQAALQAAGNLAAGETYTITVTYTPAAGAADGQSFTNTISVYSTTASSSTVRNDVPSTAPVSDTDTLNIQRGVAAVSKTADNCGTSATCTGTIVSNTTSAKPGDYLRYTVRVTNTGSGPLKFPTLRDYVPVNTEFVSVTGTTTQSNASILFSADRAAWTASAPNTLATSTFTGTVNNGPFVYVGLNSDANSTVDANDTLAASQSLTLVIVVRVR